MKTRQERGAEIEQLRLAHGLTRYGLAKKTGCSISNVTVIEQGKTSPSVETYERILEALGKRIVIADK